MVMLVFHQMNLVILSHRDTERECIVAGKILHAQVDRLVRFPCVYLDEEFPRIRITTGASAWPRTARGLRPAAWEDVGARPARPAVRRPAC